jgi:hypothetical protein
MPERVGLTPVGMRLRVGPFSVSSRGRVGVRAGPVSLYGGGRRRRRRTGSNGDPSGWLWFFALVVIGLVIFALLWTLTRFGHMIGLTPSWHELVHQNRAWEHQHYPLVGLRYVGAAAVLLVVLCAVANPFRIGARNRATERTRWEAKQAATEEPEAAERAAREEQKARTAYEEWLAGPPPFLQMPGRFTQNWIAQNAPGLHPGQVPVLKEELRRRGWTDGDIERRVAPYLANHNSSQHLHAA